MYKYNSSTVNTTLQNSYVECRECRVYEEGTKMMISFRHKEAFGLNHCFRTVLSMAVVLIVVMFDSGTDLPAFNRIVSQPTTAKSSTVAKQPW